MNFLVNTINYTIMKINLNKKFKSFNGGELGDDTMKITIAKALFSGQGVGNTEEEKFAAYKLCNRLLNEKEEELEFDKDEKKLILAASCFALTPGAYGQIREILNGGE